MILSIASILHFIVTKGFVNYYISVSFEYFDSMRFFSFFANELVGACFSSHGTWAQIFGPSTCVVRLPIFKLVGFL